jgi:hypothetical protein
LFSIPEPEHILLKTMSSVTSKLFHHTTAGAEPTLWTPSPSRANSLPATQKIPSISWEQKIITVFTKPAGPYSEPEESHPCCPMLFGGI